MTREAFQPAERLIQKLKKSDRDLSALNALLCKDFTNEDKVAHIDIDVDDGEDYAISIPFHRMRDVLDALRGVVSDYGATLQSILDSL